MNISAAQPARVAARVVAIDRHGADWDAPLSDSVRNALTKGKLMTTSKLREVITAAGCAVVMALAMLVAAPTLANADTRNGPVIHCQTSTTVGAYSRADGATFQSHTHTSTTGSTYYKSTGSYIHATTSPFRSASTYWWADSYIQVWSNSCQY